VLKGSYKGESGFSSMNRDKQRAPGTPLDFVWKTRRIPYDFIKILKKIAIWNLPLDLFKTFEIYLAATSGGKEKYLECCLLHPLIFNKKVKRAWKMTKLGP
jgi:hypothetical protein